MSCSFPYPPAGDVHSPAEVSISFLRRRWIPLPLRRKWRRCPSPALKEEVDEVSILMRLRRRCPFPPALKEELKEEMFIPLPLSRYRGRVGESGPPSHFHWRWMRCPFSCA